MEREPWAIFWMDQAYRIASRCTCAAGRAVGAVYILDNRQLVSGFNGPPARHPHPDICIRKDLGMMAGEGLNLCPCAHAETNGIANATKHHISLAGSTLYSTSKPCALCMPLIINAGIVEVIFDEDYPHLQTDLMAKHCGIAMTSFTIIKTQLSWYQRNNI